MAFDEILKEVGDFGRYQIRLFFLICVPASLPSAWSAFNHVFVAGIPKHNCTVTDPSFTVHDSQCSFNASLNETFTCTDWHFDQSNYKSTITTEFGLVCDREFWVELTQTIFYVGSLFGNIFFGFAADKFGRRVSFFLILSTLVTFGTSCAFAQNIYQFVLLRFLTGFAFPALFQIPFVISMEFMGESGRIFSGLMISVFFGSAMMLLGIVASFIREWRLLTIVCNAPFVILFIYILFLPESVRWLVSVKRFREARASFRKIAEKNRKQVDIDNLMNRVGRSALRDLVRRGFRFVNALVYNGLTLNVKNLSVNDYVSFSINGAVELPAYFILWPLLNRVGRRLCLCVSMVLGGAACLCTLFVPSDASNWTVAGMAFVGKFGIAGSFAVIYIFAGELYPTVVRAFGMGMSSMVAGIGLISAPYLVSLGNHIPILPLLIMGLMMVSAALASLFLPETMNCPSMPQTIDEAEQFGRDWKFWRLLPPADQIAKDNDRITVPLQPISNGVIE